MATWSCVALVAVMACTPSPAPPPSRAKSVPQARLRDDSPDAAYAAAQRAKANDHFAAADAAPGPRVRRDTAVLLISPAYALHSFDGVHDETGPRRFDPLLCAIHGKLATGLPCARLMPARATIRTPSGAIEVTRSRKAFIDPTREDDRGVWPAPLAPECCHYNGCQGETIPLVAAADANVADYPATVFGVWPADADIDLQVAGVGNTGVKVDDLPPTPTPSHVRQAFSRGTHRFVAREDKYPGVATWNAGAGWITAQSGLPNRGDTLIATSDIDGDGHFEIVSYQEWTNNYGLDVYVETSAKPTYSFSCGGI